MVVEVRDQPCGVVEKLVPFLPCPLVQFDGDEYYLDQDRPLSIGRVRSFYGNWGILKGLCLYPEHGSMGLRKVSETAVLNANYIMENSSPIMSLAMIVHAARVQSYPLKAKGEGVSAMDISKAIDFGFIPTTYFLLS